MDQPDDRTRKPKGAIRRYLSEAFNPPGHIPNDGPPVSQETLHREGRFIGWAAFAWLALGLLAWPFVPHGWGGYLSVACMVGLGVTACVIEYAIRRQK